MSSRLQPDSSITARMDHLWITFCKLSLTVKQTQQQHLNLQILVQNERIEQ